MRLSRSPILGHLLAGLTGFALLVGGAALPMADAAAAPPQPMTVTATERDGSIAFAWSQVPGASAYRLEVSRSGNFTGSAGDTAASVTTYATSWIAPTTLGLANPSELWYRVSAYGTATTEATRGEPSVPQLLTRGALAKPALVAPGDGATINYPDAVAFSWSAVSGAVSYTLTYIAGEFDSSSATPVTATTTATSFLPQKPLAPGLRYEWRVRANYFSGTSTPVPGPDSVLRSFSVQWPEAASQPKLLSPANSGSNPIVSDPQLRWGPVAGAKEYEVRLGSAVGASGIVEPAKVRLTGTAYIPPNTEFSNTNYFWQVVAFDANGGAGKPSEVWQFKKALSYQAAPTVAAAPDDFYPEPLTGSSVPDAVSIPLNELELQWKPVPRATAYDVEVVPHNGEPRLTCRTASTSATIVAWTENKGTEADRLKGAGACLWSFKPLERIRPGIRYTWRVRAVDYLGSSSTYLQAEPPHDAIVSDWSDEEITGQESRMRWFTVTEPEMTGPGTTFAPTLDLDAFATQTTPTLAGQPAPLLTWEPYDFGPSVEASRAGYEVTVFAKAVGSSTTVAVVRTPQTQLRINGVFDDNEVAEPYFANVRPIVVEKLDTSWGGADGIAYPSTSSADRFQWTKTSKTIDVSPKPQTLPDGTVVLSWTPQFTTAPNDGGSRGYAIKFRNSAGSEVGLEDGYKVDLPFLVAQRYDQQSSSVGKPLAPGDYTYEVAPLDANGNATRWSSRNAFTVTLPPPGVGTTQAAVGASQLVRWSPSTAAFKYQLRYKLASDPSWTKLTAADGGTTVATTDRVQTAHVFADLNPGDYVWQVRSVDTAGNTSAWSPVSTFTIPAPTLKQTTSDKAVLPVKDRVLRWNTVAGGSRYVVEVSPNPNLSAAISYETVATAFAVPTAVKAGTPYYWRVKAVPEVVNTTAGRPVLTTSTIQSFTVRTVPVAPKNVKAVADGTSLQLTWPALTGADAGGTPAHYSIQVRPKIVGDDWSVGQTITTAAEATSTLVTGLEKATTYEARVSAINSEGQGPWSAVVSATTASAPTTAPSSLQVTPGLGSLTMSWRAPSGTGGSPITGYLVRYRTGAGTWAERPVEATTKYTLTGLANEAAYSIEVAAVNVIGTGPAATAASTTFGRPGTVSSLAATPGDRSVKLTWAAPTSGLSSPVTGYSVRQRSYDPATKQWTDWATATVTTTSRVVSGLTNGTSYQFQVAAVTKVATGDYSTAVSATPAGKPAVPSSLQATPGLGSIALSWRAPSGIGGGPITGYLVRYRTGSGAWVELKLPAAAAKHTLANLASGAKYAIEVAVINASGTGPAATATSTTLGRPGTVSSLTVTPGDRTAKLTWAAPQPGSPAVTGYSVQQRSYNPTTKRWSPWSTATVTTTSRVVTGLANGTIYQFQVAAITRAGTGGYSAAVSATPAGRPGAPKLSVKAKKGKFAISWKAATNNGAAITAYVVQYSSNGKTWTVVKTTSGKVLNTTTTKGKKGKKYSFRVIARNAVGDGPSSKVVKVKKK